MQPKSIAVQWISNIGNASVRRSGMGSTYFRPQVWRRGPRVSTAFNSVWLRFCLPYIFSTQLRLGIWLLLQAREDAFCALYGIVCSSWVTINRGSSLRSLLNPQGFAEGRPHVKQANALTSRLLGELIEVLRVKLWTFQMLLDASRL